MALHYDQLSKALTIVEGLVKAMAHASPDPGSRDRILSAVIPLRTELPKAAGKSEAFGDEFVRTRGFCPYLLGGRPFLSAQATAMQMLWDAEGATGLWVREPGERIAFYSLQFEGWFPERVPDNAESRQDIEGYLRLVRDRLSSIPLDHLPSLKTDLQLEFLRAADARRRGEPDSQQHSTPPANPEDERQRKLRHALACLLTIGPNVTRIAREVGVPRTTLLGWPEFKERYEQMKANQEAARRSRRHGRRAGDRDFETDED